MIREFIVSASEILSRYNRGSIDTIDTQVQSYVNTLRSRGFVKLDHLVGSKQFSQLKDNVTQKFENGFDFQFPCLAQSKIDPVRDADLIKSNFLSTKEDLANRELTFSHDDVKSYKQMIEEFKPSTLTLSMPSSNDFYNIWLDPLVISIISTYMGFVPELTEAYIRRNFPCAYKVMNHHWHRDRNHKHYLLKAFIFFTDCDIETGAHHYIAGSVDDSRFRDKNYFDDNEINSIWPIGSNEHMISTVPAGTIIIEDTRGLHKAGVPNKNFRDLGFAVFLPPNFLRKTRSYYKTEFPRLRSVA